MVRVFTNGLEDRGLIPVIPNTQKIVLDASMLNTQHYKASIKGKCNNQGKGEAPTPTPCGSSYGKVNHQ